MRPLRAEPDARREERLRVARADLAQATYGEIVAGIRPSRASVKPNFAPATRDRDVGERDEPGRRRPARAPFTRAMIGSGQRVERLEQAAHHGRVGDVLLGRRARRLRRIHVDVGAGAEDVARRRSGSSTRVPSCGERRRPGRGARSSSPGRARFGPRAGRASAVATGAVSCRVLTALTSGTPRRSSRGPARRRRPRGRARARGACRPGR